MTLRIRSKAFQFSAAVLMFGVFCPALFAQGPLADAPDAPLPFIQPASPVVITPSGAASEHRFWDKENSALFAVSGALSVADFAVTRANLQSGGRELNPMVRIFGRSTAGLAANFASENVGLIGFSYFLHKTGHHRLERMASMVNIGGSAGAVSYGVAHRSRKAVVSITLSSPR
jgi:hypothetical protein